MTRLTIEITSQGLTIIVVLLAINAVLSFGLLLDRWMWRREQMRRGVDPRSLPS